MGTISNVSEQQRTVKILVYSSNSATRQQVQMTLGNQLDINTKIEWHEVATPPMVIESINNDEFDLLIFDGEAHKAGGMALSRQVKNEVYNSPPVILLIAREQDRWLATWSEAEAIVPIPLDPFTFPQTVQDTLSSQSLTQN